MARTALGVVRQLYQEVIIVTFSYLLGCGMAAAIADRVLLSLGDEDGGGGGSQCHDSSKYCLEKSTKDSLACGKCNIFSKD